MELLKTFFVDARISTLEKDNLQGDDRVPFIDLRFLKLLYDDKVQSGGVPFDILLVRVLSDSVLGQICQVFESDAYFEVTDNIEVNEVG